MSIDTTGRWWKGSEPGDIDEYLTAYAADATPIGAFRLAKCECGSATFSLDADDDEGVAKRTCGNCRQEHFICDSAEFWEEASPQHWSCECGSEHTNIGVAFSLYNDGEVRWLYIGSRCSECGILGCFAGWKIAYGPSKHLLDQA